ncbi:MAG: ORF6N domain-containing protein [Saprospiraceae bacterium]
MFQLTDEEADDMASQNAIPSRQHLGGYLPYAFTEHGVLMLANVLKSSSAIQMSIRIIEIFIKMREMLLTHKDILLKLEQLEREINEHDEDIRQIFCHLRQMLASPQPQRNPIGFKRNKKE